MQNGITDPSLGECLNFVRSPIALRSEGKTDASIQPSGGPLCRLQIRPIGGVLGTGLKAVLVCLHGSSGLAFFHRQVSQFIIGFGHTGMVLHHLLKTCPGLLPLSQSHLYQS
jgi:hypothetical protein